MVRLHGEGAVKRRIMDMGITKGAEVRIRKTAPLGDPVELFLRGYVLTIRHEDAAKIEITEVQRAIKAIDNAKKDAKFSSLYWILYKIVNK